MVYPLWKNANFGLFLIDVSKVSKDFHSFWNFTKQFLLIHFELKEKLEKVLIFGQKPWSNPFGKRQIMGLL